MAVDWGFAEQVGSFGFGLVFLISSILAVAIWLVPGKTGAGKGEAEDKKKGD
jgi:Na+-transporting methylmalonyl-CoA/oxaloacetate decarboxylase gamma subunit